MHPNIPIEKDSIKYIPIEKGLNTSQLRRIGASTSHGLFSSQVGFQVRVAARGRKAIAFGRRRGFFTPLSN